MSVTESVIPMILMGIFAACLFAVVISDTGVRNYHLKKIIFETITMTTKVFRTLHWPIYVLIVFIFVYALLFMISISPILILPIVNDFIFAVFELEKRSHIGLVVFSLILSILLFILRRKTRVIYGLLEIVISIAGLWKYRLSPEDGSYMPFGSWLAAWMALIYFLIRGLDNVEVGYEKWKVRTGDPKDESTPVKPSNTGWLVKIENSLCFIGDTFINYGRNWRNILNSFLDC